MEFSANVNPLSQSPGAKSGGFLMGSASKWFFFLAEGRLTRTRNPDYVAPKPLPAKWIEKLGAALERAEYEVANMWDDEFLDARSAFANPEDYVDAVHHRFHVLKMEYGQALAARNEYQRCKLENSKRVHSDREGGQLKLNMWHAMNYINKLEELGSDFSTYREFVDANSASALAISVYEIAQHKFQNAQRRDAADHKAGIVRKTHRRKPHEVHL
jgi:hypothetical protein